MKRNNPYSHHLPFALLLLCALVFSGACSGDHNGTEEETANEIPVQAYTVETGPVDHTLRYIGTTSGEREIRLFSKVPDRIIDLPADEGDLVSEGEVLAAVENTLLKEAVAQAESGLRTARAHFENVKREYERAGRLYKEDAISHQDFDRAETQFESAKGSLEQAESALSQASENLKNTYIRAPFDGVVNERFLDLGDMATAGAPVFSLIQTEKIKVSLHAVDREFAHIEVGQGSRLRLRKHPDTVFTGTVSKKRPAFDPMTRLARIETIFPNDEGLILPGMFGEIELILDEKENVPLIPVQAVLHRIDLDETLGRLVDEQLVRQPYVYVIENGRAVRRDIETGYETMEVIEIIRGVEPGEQVVVRGQHNLAEGDRVTIAKEIALSLEE